MHEYNTLNGLTADGKPATTGPWKMSTLRYIFARSRQFLELIVDKLYRFANPSTQVQAEGCSEGTIADLVRTLGVVMDGSNAFHTVRQLLAISTSSST